MCVIFFMYPIIFSCSNVFLAKIPEQYLKDIAISVPPSKFTICMHDSGFVFDFVKIKLSNALNSS